MFKREINRAIWHCSADREGDLHGKDIHYIDKMHREKKGFRKVGYHIVILPDGTIQYGRRINETGAHVMGHNDDSIGICYIGGLDYNGVPKDTRTIAQIAACAEIRTWLDYFIPGIEHVGHRDLSPDTNGDGMITQVDWLKSCPCFDVKTEL